MKVGVFGVGDVEPVTATCLAGMGNGMLAEHPAARIESGCLGTGVDARIGTHLAVRFQPNGIGRGAPAQRLPTAPQAWLPQAA